MKSKRTLKDTVMTVMFLLTFVSNLDRIVSEELNLSNTLMPSVLTSTPVSPSQAHSHSSSSTVTFMKGIAKVTPISFKSTSVRVGENRVLPSPTFAHPSPTISTVSALIPHVTNSFNRKPLFSSPSSSSSFPSSLSSPLSFPSIRRPKSIINSSDNFSSTLSPMTISATTVHPSLSDSNLCFLAHGGSSETFAVNEAAVVGSVIGTIKVIGNASTTIELAIITNNRTNENGDSNNRNIDLVNRIEVNSNDIPIRIENGTDRLVLARKLDKESPEGESGISISVRCRPRHIPVNVSFSDLSQRTQRQMQPGNYAISPEYQSEDDIIIPIRILITDANDNKPEWQGELPYRVNISETTPLGSVVFSQLRAIDNDQLGPYSTVEYHIESGPFSHLLRFSSPLEGTLILAAPLDYETLPKFWVNIRAQDQGNPPNSAITRLEVNVLDADDQNPRFEFDKYTAVVHESQKSGQTLDIEPKSIKAEDPDKVIRSPIVYAFNSEGDEQESSGQFRIDSKTGIISLSKTLSPNTILPLTLVIRATQLDNRDRYALTTLAVLNKRQAQVSGSQLRFQHSNYTISLLESSPVGHSVLIVHTSRSSDTLSQDRVLRYQILDDEEGHFDVRSNGEIILKKVLDFERIDHKSFRVMVTDGRQSDVARVTVQVINVNEHDPVFSAPTYAFHVNEARLKSSPVIGQIEANDADRGDKVHIALSGLHAYAFAYSTQDSMLRVRNLRMLNFTECHMIATATDSGTPSRSSTASIVVRFTPTLVKTLIVTQSRMRGAEPSGFFTDWNQDENEELTGSMSASDILQQSASDLFAASTNSTALVLVIVLGVLLGTLFIIIVALTLHVLKNRKYEHRSVSPTAAVLHHHHHHRSELGSSGSGSIDESASSASSSDGISGSGDGLYSHYQAPTNNRHFQHGLAKTNIPLAISNSSDRCSAKNNPLFNGLRLSTGLAKVSPLSDSDDSGLEQYHANTSASSHNAHSSVSSSHHQALSSHHLHHHDHSLHSREDQSSSTGNDHEPKFIRKTFMDSEIQLERANKNEKIISAVSSDSGVNGEHIDSSDGSRSSSADLINGNTSINTISAVSGSNSAGISQDSDRGSRISVIKWPQGSIPRRVKKLTWQDEQRNNHLDAMYTQNETMPIPVSLGVGSGNKNVCGGEALDSSKAGIIPAGIASLITKTKTLSGHLLTGINHHSAGNVANQQANLQQNIPQPMNRTSTTKSFEQFVMLSSSSSSSSSTTTTNSSSASNIMSSSTNVSEALNGNSSSGELEQESDIVPNKNALHYHLYAPPPHPHHANHHHTQHPHSHHHHHHSQQTHNHLNSNPKSTLSDLTVYF